MRQKHLSTLSIAPLRCCGTTKLSPTKPAFTLLKPEGRKRHTSHTGKTVPSMKSPRPWDRSVSSGCALVLGEQ